MAKYPQVLDESVASKSTNREFTAMSHVFALYEQTRKRLSCFHPKRKVDCDGKHTKSLKKILTAMFGLSVFFFE